jgi:hypothetical protein
MTNETKRGDSSFSEHHILESPGLTEIGGQPEEIIFTDNPKPLVDSQGNIPPDVFKAMIAAGSGDGSAMLRGIQEGRRER